MNDSSFSIVLEAKDIAIVIVALGAAGIPLLLIGFTVGGLVFGFALWSILNFLGQWMIPLIFFGAGIVALIELVPRGTKMALAGVGFLALFVFLGYFAWSGAFNGPTNTYSLFYSVTPGAPSGPLPMSSIVFGLAVTIGIVLSAYGGYKLIEGE